MFWFDNNEDNYRMMQPGQVKVKEDSLNHEVIAGGAAFSGVKMFEEHQRKEGKPVSHEFAKELIAGFAGSEVDKFADERGDHWYDRDMAKRKAKEKSQEGYDEHYGEYDQYDPSQQSPPEAIQKYINS